MSEFIEVGKLCMYIGPGNGRMVKHRILESSLKSVVTWSQFKLNDMSEPGYSWMGDRHTFCQHFRPLLPSEL